jgi:hypothetical protein
MDVDRGHGHMGVDMNLDMGIDPWTWTQHGNIDMDRWIWTHGTDTWK